MSCLWMCIVIGMGMCWRFFSWVSGRSRWLRLFRLCLMLSFFICWMCLFMCLYVLVWWRSNVFLVFWRWRVGMLEWIVIMCDVILRFSRWLEWRRFVCSSLVYLWGCSLVCWFLMILSVWWVLRFLRCLKWVENFCCVVSGVGWWLYCVVMLLVWFVLLIELLKGRFVRIGLRIFVSGFCVYWGSFG